MHLILTRFCYGPKGVGTFGELVLPDGWRCWTAEEAWGPQHAGADTCIPIGEYTLRETVYVKHNIPTYEVTGVPGRSRILLHTGNRPTADSAGCILVGRGLGVVQGEWAITNSRDAFQALMSRIDAYPEHLLTIQNIDAGVVRD